MTQTTAEKAQLLADTHCVVIIDRKPTLTLANVHSGDRMYYCFYHSDGTFSCACTWGTYHNYTTDLCAHALALKLVLEKETS